MRLQDILGNGSFNGQQFLFHVTATRRQATAAAQLNETACRFEDLQLLVDGCPALLVQKI